MDVLEVGGGVYDWFPRGFDLYGVVGVVLVGMVLLGLVWIHSSKKLLHFDEKDTSYPFHMLRSSSSTLHYRNKIRREKILSTDITVAQPSDLDDETDEEDSDEELSNEEETDIETSSIVRPYSLIQNQTPTPLDAKYDFQLYELHEKKEFCTPYYTPVIDEEEIWRGFYEGFESIQEKREESENWNVRFQKIMKKISNFTPIGSPLTERDEAHRNLIHLAKDFLYSSSTYGKIIISEVYLSPEEKTIKPQQLGYAGGEKYIINKIMFKFAFDSKGLYGSDYAAAKVAGNELKGLISYLNCWSTICLPLMALVDYRGFRLTAMSILPIDKDTLVYGTSDYGKTIHCEDPQFAKIMKKLGKQLNLKSHYCGLDRRGARRLFSACDLEGHKGRDGNYYLLDFSRVLPPETPKPGVKSAHLYRLLRPEFVKNYRKPLCPDAFSGFIARQPKMSQHNQEVREATHYLLHNVIPSYAMEFTNTIVEAKKQGRLEKFRVTEAIHQKGINIRHIGTLRAYTTEPDVRTLLFVQMAARVFKNNLRFQLREKMKEFRIPLEEPYVRIVIDYLNLVFGESSESETYWNTEFRMLIIHKFDNALSEKEAEASFPLKCLLDSFSADTVDGKLMLFKRIQKMLGLEFSARLNKDLHENRNSWLSRGDKPFDDTDLKQIGLRVKHMNIIVHAQGFYFKEKGKIYWDRDPVVAKRFFRKATKKFIEALDIDPDNQALLCNWAEVAERLIEGESKGLAHIKFNPQDKAVKQTDEIYKRAIRIDPHNSKTLFRYAQFLEKCNKTDLAEDYYLLSLEANPYNLEALHEYANFLSDHQSVHEAEKFYIRYSDISKTQHDGNNHDLDNTSLSARNHGCCNTDQTSTSSTHPEANPSHHVERKTSNVKDHLSWQFASAIRPSPTNVNTQAALPSNGYIDQIATSNATLPSNGYIDQNAGLPSNGYIDQNIPLPPQGYNDRINTSNAVLPSTVLIQAALPSNGYIDQTGMGTNSTEREDPRPTSLRSSQIIHTPYRPSSQNQ